MKPMKRYHARRDQFLTQWESYQTLYLPEQVEQICRDLAEELYDEYGELHDEPSLKFGALFVV